MYNRFVKSTDKKPMVVYLYIKTVLGEVKLTFLYKVLSLKTVLPELIVMCSLCSFPQTKQTIVIPGVSYITAFAYIFAFGICAEAFSCVLMLRAVIREM